MKTVVNSHNIKQNREDNLDLAIMGGLKRDPRRVNICVLYVNDSGVKQDN